MFCVYWDNYTYNSHSTANSRATLSGGIFRDEQMMTTITKLELGTDGRARVKMALSKLSTLEKNTSQGQVQQYMNIIENKKMKMENVHQMENNVQ